MSTPSTGSTPPTGRARVPGSGVPSRPLRPTGSVRPLRTDNRPLRTDNQPPPKRKIKPRWGRIALVLGILTALIVGGVALSGYLFVNHLNNKLTRVDAFAGITGGRPPVLVKGAQNILLLGSDSRDPSEASTEAGWRTDTIILMHIDADHAKAYMISIPRDTWVYIPKSPSKPSLGNQYAKINAAYAWGGVPLTVETVERFTGVHVDHAMVIDFAGFAQVTDALGGVNMYIDQTITSIHPPYRVFTKGNHHLNGAQALDYIRQRKQFASGDFARVQHQQQFLKDIMDAATSSGTLTSPTKLSGFLGAISKAVVVDDSFNLASMAVQFHNLRSNDLTFITSPSAGTGMEAGQSVVLSDKTKSASLYAAVSKDGLATWLAANPTS
jgi:LCP family protein required for cell wall assembly